MQNWLKVLPVFIYQWLARKYCGTASTGRGTNVTHWHKAAPDILVRKK